jgi:glucan phosphoethanolaminetransferase (alkaline phosphatase superfamily)
MIIYLLCSFIFFKENLFLIVPLLIGVIYNFWVFHQVFESKKAYINLLFVLFAYMIFIGLTFVTCLLIFLGAKVLGY